MTKTQTLSASLGLVVAAGLVAAADLAGDEEASKRLEFTADRIAVDNVTGTAVATGNVVAVEKPFSLRSDCLSRDAEGVYRLHDPTCVTTCTNAVGHTHWNLTGEVEYRSQKYAILRNAWLTFYELPVLWLPYAYYPLDSTCDVRVMPGYTGRWGAYLLTKFLYDIAGDSQHRDNTWWLHGNTRFDLRYENGIALGETLNWNLGDFGKGKFKIYYAWDDNTDEYEYGGSSDDWDRGNWGSLVERDRYAIELSHRWEPTERDVVRLKGSVFSDSYFREDFFRDNTFNLKNQWLGYDGNEIAWEHAENAFGFGAAVSGSLNEFYGSTAQLPEVYLDVAPRPFFCPWIDYETENRMGYLSRSYAEYGVNDPENAFARNPGAWAEYEAFRFDTYHRFSAPVRTCDDVLSVVPRLGYHGTGWGRVGCAELSGWEEAESRGPRFRSVFESGVTFAGRGTGWVDDRWRHVFEPYLDALAQKACWNHSSNGSRPYYFDNIDASRTWEDQFAGRARNLPYSYCGVTPGWRNAWSKADEKGALKQILDFDVYAAMQFNQADFFGDDENHRLAYADSPNYGRYACYVSPGTRLRWTPAEDIALMTRAEYDPDYNRLAYADVSWNQRISRDFSYYVRYVARDHRWWDYSSTPYNPEQMKSDDMNWASFQHVEVGFTNQPIDWFAWSPYLRWDCREGELDSVGAWFDYLTDCLGFRLIVSYENEYTRVDGYTRDADWDIGFYVYLRAFGAGTNPFR